MADRLINVGVAGFKRGKGQKTPRKSGEEASPPRARNQHEVKHDGKRPRGEDK